MDALVSEADLLRLQRYSSFFSWTAFRPPNQLDGGKDGPLTLIAGRNGR